MLDVLRVDLTQVPSSYQSMSPRAEHFVFSFLCFNGQCIESVECIWNGKFTYARRIRPDSGTSYQNQVFEPTIFSTLSVSIAMFAIRKQNMSQKNTILLWEQWTSVVQREKRITHSTELFISVFALFFCCFFFISTPNGALVIDLIGTKENTLMHTMPDMPEKKKKKKRIEWKKKKINLRNILPLSMPKVFKCTLKNKYMCYVLSLVYVWCVVHRALFIHRWPLSYYNFRLWKEMSANAHTHTHTPLSTMKEHWTFIRIVQKKKKYNQHDMIEFRMLRPGSGFSGNFRYNGKINYYAQCSALNVVSGSVWMM